MEFDLDRWVKKHIVQESAATAEQIKIHETPVFQSIGKISEAEQAGTTRRRVKIIQSGWGSSGYYPKEMLERDGPQVWPIGTHMYLNHPSLTEELEQPERRVEDLAAVIASTPVMESGALYADADIFEHHATVINAIAENIGVSIRAIGESVDGEVEGKHGPVILKLTEGISVDFVTKAGAGGEVGPLIESARKAAIESAIEEARNAGNWLEAKLHREFTWIADDLFAQGNVTRVERIALSSAVGDALNAFHDSVEAKVPQLYKRDPFDVPEQEGVVEEGRSGGKPTKEDVMSDDEKGKLSEMETRLKQLEDDVAEAKKTATENEERAERAEDALALEKARNIVNEALDSTEVEEGQDALPELPERARKRVVESALRGELPLTEDKKLDQDKLIERVHKAVRDESEYLTGAPGSGKVTGMGVAETAANGSSPAGGNGEVKVSESQEKKLVEHFQRSGMSEEAATIAARGR